MRQSSPRRRESFTAAKLKNADEEPRVRRGEGWRPLVAVKKKHPSHMTLGFAKVK